MDGKIRAIIIVEIAGRPAEHVKKTLELHVSELKKNKEVSVISISVSEPKKIEQDNQEFFTCFAEVELEVSRLSDMIGIVFDYMPSSIEILEPQELEFNLSDATTFLNDLSGRLHKYDGIAKVSQLQAEQAINRLQILQRAISQDEIIKKRIEEKFKVKAPKVSEVASEEAKEKTEEKEERKN